MTTKDELYKKAKKDFDVKLDRRLKRKNLNQCEFAIL